MPLLSSNIFGAKSYINVAQSNDYKDSLTFPFTEDLRGTTEGLIITGNIGMCYRILDQHVFGKNYQGSLLNQHYRLNMKRESFHILHSLESQIYERPSVSS